jgi:hypothetical protein
MSTDIRMRPLKASTRVTGVVFLASNKDRNNEAFGSGTGDGGVLGRRACSRYDPPGFTDSSGCHGDACSSGHDRNQEGQEEEGEEAHGHDEHVCPEYGGSEHGRPGAHEVNRSHFLSKPETTEESQMNKLLVALIAGAFVSVAAAQTAAPAPASTTKEKQADVQATTAAGSGSSASTQKTAAEQAKNVKASKEVPKMTTAEKNKAIKDVNKSGVNPENPSGSTTATAAQAKANTAASKEVPKQNTELKTKEGQKQLSKELQDKAKNQ